MVGTGGACTARMHTCGNLQQTGNNLDIAINGRGFFQVQMPDGTTYTLRDGFFHRDANGIVVTSNAMRCSPRSLSGDRRVDLHCPDGTVQATLAGPGRDSGHDPGTTGGLRSWAEPLKGGRLRGHPQTGARAPPSRRRRELCR